MLQAPSGPVRDLFLQQLRVVLPPSRPFLRCPLAADADRLFGGLDLSASLVSGRPVSAPGLLDTAAGGLLALPAALLSPPLASRLAAHLDAPPRGALPGFLLLAEPEEREGDDPLPFALVDRLPLFLGLDPTILPPDLPPELPDRVAAAAALLSVSAPPASPDGVASHDDLASALCEAAFRLGIPSVRAPLHALRVAWILAALDGRSRLDAEDAALAARLVLLPRVPATSATAPDTVSPPAAPPATSPGETEGAEPPASSPSEAAAHADPATEAPPPPDTASSVLDAIRASLPPGLLDRAPSGSASRPAGISGADSGSRSAASRTAARSRTPAATRGRRAGTVPGRPFRDGRLALFATFCAALPFQHSRRGGSPGDPLPDGSRLRIRTSDLRVRRIQPVPRTCTVLVVDASGSAARDRLREAKGAAELLLLECYRRRDRVALLAFRDRGCTLLVPPTASLTLARRRLLGLPAGGGTPLAAALRAAHALADRVARDGLRPLLVLLTDARANVALDGTPDRDRAAADAALAARALRAAGHPAILLDTAPRPDPRARALAEAMRARYLPLPRAAAPALASAIRDAAPGS
ncbi:MAG: VWA domain-containing protein [Gluconacetobacter diazotrophicus]|nr:VWA domain-containing protein [Gluconacetobacter diazotrophicus]